MSVMEKEKYLEEMGEKMGKIFEKASPEKKQILREIKQTVENFAKEMEEKGKYIDKASMFSAGIIIDQRFADEDELLDTAKEYVDATYDYLQELKKEQTV